MYIYTTRLKGITKYLGIDDPDWLVIAFSVSEGHSIFATHPNDTSWVFFSKDKQKSTATYNATRLSQRSILWSIQINKKQVNKSLQTSPWAKVSDWTSPS